jgi:hypothetical protein
MNKTLGVCIPLLLVTLLVSASTAVPQVQGNQVLQKIEDMQQHKDILATKCTQIREKINTYFKEKAPLPAGIIELLIQIILILIRIVESIIQFILEIMELGVLIEYLIGRILVLIDLIIQFVEWILNLFNPTKIMSSGL